MFGFLSQDPTAIFANYNLTSKSFNIVEYEGKEIEPYIIYKKHTIFYQDKLYVGINTLNKYDTLRIQMTSTGLETVYLKRLKKNVQQAI